MNPRITIAFVAAVLILAAVVTGLDRYNVGNVNATPTPVTQGVPVFTFDDTKVTVFTATDGTKSVRFVKNGDNWAIDGDPNPANQTSLTSLIIQLSTLQATNLVTTSTDNLAQFGLDKPTTEATAELSDGSKYTLQFGGTSPIGTGTYAHDPATNNVVVVASTLSSSLKHLVAAPEQPPTPTPLPSPTATAAGTPAPAGTPSPAATP